MDPVRTNPTQNLPYSSRRLCGLGVPGQMRLGGAITGNFPVPRGAAPDQHASSLMIGLAVNCYQRTVGGLSYQFDVGFHYESLSVRSSSGMVDGFSGERFFLNRYSGIAVNLGASVGFAVSRHFDLLFRTNAHFGLTFADGNIQGYHEGSVGLGVRFIDESLMRSGRRFGFFAELTGTYSLRTYLGSSSFERMQVPGALITSGLSFF